MDAYLPERQQNLLRQLGPALHNLGFYLAGGTALAIYYQHRLSIDLDWFSENPIGDAMLLASKLQNQVALRISEVGPGTLHALSGQVHLSFLEYRYPLLEPVTISPEFDAPLASLADIACMKLSAVAQRGSKKDFIDVHALVQRYRPLPDLLSLYQKKYQIGDLASVLYGLVYFDDAESEPLPQNWQGSWPEVMQSFRKWVKAIN
jgi:hypothetical protein